MAFSVNQSAAVLKSDQFSGGAAQPVSWHLPREEQARGGGGEGKRASMSGWEGGKTQLPLCLSPVLLLKGVGGERRETAGTICTRLLYSSPRLYTERGWCARCSNERIGGAFWGCSALVCVSMQKFDVVLGNLPHSEDILCPCLFVLVQCH